MLSCLLIDEDAPEENAVKGSIDVPALPAPGDTLHIRDERAGVDPGRTTIWRVQGVSRRWYFQYVAGLARLTCVAITCRREG